MNPLTMSFHSNASSSEVMKSVSDLTVEQLLIELESRSSKQLAKDDLVVAVNAIE